MAVFNTNARNRQVIIKVNKNKYKVIWRESDTEMNNNADIHCFGSKEECTVSPLLPEYTEEVNIQICTGVTALSLD